MRGAGNGRPHDVEDVDLQRVAADDVEHEELADRRPPAEHVRLDAEQDREHPNGTGACGAIIVVAAGALAAFGWKALQAFVLIGQNQERTTRWSVPQKLADGVGALTGGDPDAIVHFTRGALGLLLAIAIAYLLRYAWRARPDPRAWVLAAGWATLAVLVATAWLVPWYAIWVLPLAAISRSRALMVATVMLCAYMLVIAVPL